MIVLGLTGGTGAGKTTALNVLKEFGAYIIDCDAVYHELLQSSDEMQREICSAFPQCFKASRFDRKELGKIVFGNKSALDKLNTITHKYVLNEIDRVIESERSSGRKIVAIDAILLIESGAGKRCDKIIGVIAPASVRAERIMKRENITRDYALSRINSQKSDEFFIENCDYILKNDCKDVSEFSNRCKILFSNITGGN